jgi:hypothetical protein
MAEERTGLVEGVRDGFKPRNHDVLQEHLPERWVDLIQYLNAQEREREASARKKRMPDVPH